MVLVLHTFSMASWTLSDWMSWFFARLLTRASLVAPELLQAIPMALFGTLLRVELMEKEPQVRASFVSTGTVDSDTGCEGNEKSLLRWA